MSDYKESLETSIIVASTRGDSEIKTGSVNVPIYLSSTFHQESFDDFGPYDYSRSGNPTRDALEKTIAELEGGLEDWHLHQELRQFLLHLCFCLQAIISLLQKTYTVEPFVLLQKYCLVLVLSTVLQILRMWKQLQVQCNQIQN